VIPSGVAPPLSLIGLVHANVFHAVDRFDRGVLVHGKHGSGNTLGLDLDYYRLE